MVLQVVRPAAILAACLWLAGCGLLDLREDLQHAQREFTRVAGRVEAPSCVACPTIVVALGSLDGGKVDTFRVFEKPGPFEIVTTASSRYLFAFNDRNGDFEYQPGEPFALQELPPLAAGGRVDGIVLPLKRVGADVRLPRTGHLLAQRGTTLGNIDVKLGALTSLDNAYFDADFAGLGMWQPLTFMRNGYAGVYFLEPYSPAKTPVLFVHGINGSPRDFAALVARLDRKRYQPWVLYYPSGIELGALGDAMHGMLTELQQRHRFQHLHLVAHSMGGLVTRSYLDVCEKRQGCDYVRSFVSISSPFAGHAAAKSGLEYSPVVMPVWRSLSPDSAFLASLFARPLPNGIPHYLLFGYRNDSLLGSPSGDGVIPLASQLRPDVQVQARAVRGFDEGHMSILNSDAALDYVIALLSKERPK